MRFSTLTFITATLLAAMAHVGAADVPPAMGASAPAKSLKCAKGFDKVKVITASATPKMKGFDESMSVDYAGKRAHGGMLMPVAEYKQRNLAVGVEWCLQDQGQE